MNKFRTLSIVLILLTFLTASSSLSSFAAEDWKGKAPEHSFTFGAQTGLGIINSRAGFAIMGNVAKKIVNQGFVPDINNQVFLELQIGPVFISGNAATLYGAHIRWDFIKDSDLTLFTTGGLGGHITPASLGDEWKLYPRFGVGAFWNISSSFALRAEISHEMTLVGASFPF